MKRIVYLFMALSLILFSCEKSPVASFSTDTDQPEVGRPVEFNNNSNNADRFEWDFGDGYMSNESNPVHTFTATGSYEVTLTITSKNGHTDTATMTITVVVPTLLEIEVREYYSDDLIPNASIILYPTLPDWNNQKNSVVEGFTNGNGVAVFSNLDPYIYYVDVYEADHDNYTLADEDINFIRTPEVLAHRITRFIAYVDIVDHGKGAARGTRDFVIKKLERKASEKRQPVADGGTDNWEELYSRRVNK